MTGLHLPSHVLHVAAEIEGEVSAKKVAVSATKFLAQGSRADDSVQLFLRQGLTFWLSQQVRQAGDFVENVRGEEETPVCIWSATMRAALLEAVNEGIQSYGASLEESKRGVHFEISKFKPSFSNLDDEVCMCCFPPLTTYETLCIVYMCVRTMFA